MGAPGGKERKHGPRKTQASHPRCLHCLSPAPNPKKGRESLNPNPPPEKGEERKENKVEKHPSIDPSIGCRIRRATPPLPKSSPPLPTPSPMPPRHPRCHVVIKQAHGKADRLELPLDPTASDREQTNLFFFFLSEREEEEHCLAEADPSIHPRAPPPPQPTVTALPKPLLSVVDRCVCTVPTTREVGCDADRAI